LYLTLPDGRRVGFTFTPEKHELPGLVFYTPVFTPDSGVDFILRPAQTLLTRADDDTFFDLRTARAYNPASGLFQGPEYTLTGPDGMSYQLSTKHGLEEEIRPGGVRLVYSDSGIVSSTGATVRFVRDGQGRIAAIVGPAGEHIDYVYGPSVDQLQVRQSASSVTTWYAYDQPHQLRAVVQGTGRGGYVIEPGQPPVILPLTANLGGFSSSPRAPTRATWLRRAPIALRSRYAIRQLGPQAMAPYW
jgi:hypothetical protein